MQPAERAVTWALGGCSAQGLHQAACTQGCPGFLPAQPLHTLLPCTNRVHSSQGALHSILVRGITDQGHVCICALTRGAGVVLAAVDRSSQGAVERAHLQLPCARLRQQYGKSMSQLCSYICMNRNLNY